MRPAFLYADNIVPADDEIRLQIWRKTVKSQIRSDFS